MRVPRLHPDTINQVKERSDIVDIVSDHVVLRKQGKDFVGLCPFHDDKSPSFSVSPSKQFYYCFSCGAGGNSIKFLMELGKDSFTDVVLGLANRYQVPIQTLEPAKRQEFQRKISLREKLYEVLALTVSFYEHSLYLPQGQQALAYLESSRQLSGQTIQRFQLGYAPGGWQTLYNYLVRDKGFAVELVEQAGLIVPRRSDNGSGEGYYDRFRDRLMIPIHDLQGRVIGFGGRTLSDAQPKYLNSPDTELFDKGKTLFGLDKAKQAIAQEDCAIVVEGYFDVIALHAAGISQSVASLGTALNVGQVKQLLRYTDSKRVVLNFDADNAGTKAAKRAIGETEELAYSGDVQLRVLNIPQGKDPDEFLQSHSADDYRALLKKAPLWLDWQIQQLFSDKDLAQSDHFQQVSQQVVDLLSDISNATTRTHYVRQCAEQLSQGDGRLVPLLAENLLAQVRRKRRKSPDGAEIPKAVVGPVDFLEQAEATLLRIYLHASSYRQAVVDALDERDLQFSFSHHRFLWRTVLGMANQSGEWDLVSFLREQRAEADQKAAENQLEQVAYLFQLNEKTQRDILRAPLVIQAATDCLERVMCEKRYQHFRDLWAQTDVSVSPELCEFYQQQLYAEKRRMHELDVKRSVSFEDLTQLPWVGSFYEELER
ncbi:MAG: DNA primase [Cyanobacteria bacterium P01_F01_bin.150]